MRIPGLSDISVNALRIVQPDPPVHLRGQDVRPLKQPEIRLPSLSEQDRHRGPWGDFRWRDFGPSFSTNRLRVYLDQAEGTLVEKGRQREHQKSKAQKARAEIDEVYPLYR
jgi:hypothetical protein